MLVKVLGRVIVELVARYASVSSSLVKRYLVCLQGFDLTEVILYLVVRVIELASQVSIVSQVLLDLILKLPILNLLVHIPIVSPPQLPIQRIIIILQFLNSLLIRPRSSVAILSASHLPRGRITRVPEIAIIFQHASGGCASLAHILAV